MWGTLVRAPRHSDPLSACSLPSPPSPRSGLGPRAYMHMTLTEPSCPAQLRAMRAVVEGAERLPITWAKGKPNSLRFVSRASLVCLFQCMDRGGVVKRLQCETLHGLIEPVESDIEADGQGRARFALPRGAVRWAWAHWPEGADRPFGIAPFSPAAGDWELFARRPLAFFER